MLKNTETTRLSRRYALQTVVAVTVLSLGVISMHMFAHVDGLVSPLVVSVVFALVVELIDIYLWKRIADANEKMLPTYFSAVSGCCWLYSLSWVATLLLVATLCLNIVWCLWSSIYG